MREETGGHILHRSAIHWGRRREEEKPWQTRQPARRRGFLWSFTQTCTIFCRAISRSGRFLPARSQWWAAGR